MSEVVQETHQEFWRPPSPVIPEEIVFREAALSMAVACKRCGTEFLPGSHFCHSCGSRRPQLMSEVEKADAAALAGMWEQGVARFYSGVSAIAQTSRGYLKVPNWLRYLQFHQIKESVALPTASLIAFVIGISCIAGALLVGLLTAKTFVDWQAIQFYRVEWLLGATASFLAGILLKKSGGNDRN